MGGVITDKGAWIFKIKNDYQKKLFPPISEDQVTFVYESDDFFNMIAHPLFGDTNPSAGPPLPGQDVPSKSRYALLGLPPDKNDYRKAFIISTGGRTKGDIASSTFITALAWALKDKTGLDVQWFNSPKSRNSPKRFVFHRQPSDSTHQNQDFEIFFSGAGLLTYAGKAASPELKVQEDTKFDKQSFPEKSTEVPNGFTAAARLWKQYSSAGNSVVKAIGFQKDKPHTQLIEWNFNPAIPPTIFRHLNNGDQINIIIILVVTTKGMWSLMLPMQYLGDSKFGSISNLNVNRFRKEDKFLKFKSAVLDESANEASWYAFAEKLSCFGALLVDVFVLSGYPMGGTSDSLNWKTMIKAILVQMMKTSAPAGWILEGLETRDIPFFTFPTGSRKERKAKNDRFIMRHSSESSLVDEDKKKEIGPGEFFECYYGGMNITNTGVGQPLPGSSQHQFFSSSDPSTRYFRLFSGS